MSNRLYPTRDLPDAILPSQTGGKKFTPEQLQLLSVIEDALSDLAKYPRTHVLHRDAARWFNGCEAPIMFADAATYLGWDPEAVQQAMRRKGLIPTPPARACQSDPRGPAIRQAV